MQVCPSSPLSNEPIPSWGELSTEIKYLLVAAANSWENTPLSEGYIQRALEIANGSLDVLVAAYRYFFYKHNDAAALQMATQVVEQIHQTEKFTDDWETLAPILFARKEEHNIRLYLNAYAASGLVMARMGAIEAAKEITARVKQIDDRREFGAATVWQILTQLDEEDE